MIQLFPYLIMNALFIWGFHVLFNEGMILGRAGIKMKEVLPGWIHKPSFSCPVCMSSIFGTAAFFAISIDYLMWPGYCICLSGLNYLLTKLTSKERVIVEDE